MNVAISGIRDLAEADLPVIELAIADILSEKPLEMFFGGARGTDTVALAAACAILEGCRPPKLTVIVPRRVKDQPAEAREWISECADEVIELKAERLDPAAYRHRNRELIRRADGLVAFWDGRSRGTGMTIELAEQVGLPIEIFYLKGIGYGLGDSGGGVHRPSKHHEKPWAHWVYGPTSSVRMPVMTLGLYMALPQGLDRLSQFIRATKAETVRADETRYWATVMADVISARPELKDAAVIIPMPRRTPGRKNDLADLVAQVARETGKMNGTDLLVRVEDPTGAQWKGRRERFDSDEHARTMAVDPEHRAYDVVLAGPKVILLDNVFSFGGSMEGARKALERDLIGLLPMGFAIQVSGDYAISR